MSSLLSVSRSVDRAGMICPNTRGACENPGCRHGGCQGVSRQYPTAGQLRALLSEVVATETVRGDLRDRILQALRGGD